MVGDCRFLLQDFSQVFSFLEADVFFSSLQVWSSLMFKFLLYPKYQQIYSWIVVSDSGCCIGFILDFVKVRNPILMMYFFLSYFFLISLYLFLSFDNIVLTGSWLLLFFLMFHDLIDICHFIGVMYFKLTFLGPLLYYFVLSRSRNSLMSILLVFKEITSFGNVSSVFHTFFKIGKHFSIFHYLCTINVFLFDMVAFNSFRAEFVIN